MCAYVPWGVWSWENLWKEERPSLPGLLPPPSWSTGWPRARPSPLTAAGLGIAFCASALGCAARLASGLGRGQ